MDACGAKMLAKFGLKMTKEAIFIPITFIPTQFSLRNDVFTDVKNELKDELNIFFTETNCELMERQTSLLKGLTCEKCGAKLQGNLKLVDKNPNIYLPEMKSIKWSTEITKPKRLKSTQKSEKAKLGFTSLLA